MTDTDSVPDTRVLYVIACGGRPAGDLPDFIKKAQDQAFDVCVIATPEALKFMDTDEIQKLTGHAVRYDWKQPEEPDALPPADVMLVAPATFNTINKWAHGISDTLALGLLNEAIGLGIPVIAIPNANVALAEHPVFSESIGRLRSWGITVLFDPEKYPLPTPNSGEASRALFPWKAALTALVQP
jgi:phosphopantothenoylcysteine synthetase/decarboxylase